MANLKAFEDLKETTANSLDGKEKADLNKLSPDDIRTEKEKIGDKVFVVDGKSMKLKDIAQNLKFNAAGTKATFNGNEIAWASELGAALQVYAIAYNKSIGNFLIDGKIGANSVSGLQGAQTEAKLASQSKQPETVRESGETTSRLTSLLKCDYRRKVGKYSDTQYNLLITKSGDMEGALKNTKISGNEVEVTYKSAIGRKEQQTVKINANNCKDAGGLYSANKFGSVIAEAIRQNEETLERKDRERKGKEAGDALDKSIVDGINGFSESRISDAVVRKYLSQRGGNLTCSKGDIVNWKVTIHSLSDKTINKTDLLKNGEFDVKKFEKIVVSLYREDALAYVKGEINKSKDNIKNSGTLANISDAKSCIQKCDDLIKEIDSYGAEDDLKQERAAVVALKTSAENTKKTLEKNKENQDAYKAKSGEMRKDLNLMKSKANARLSRMEVRQARTDCISIACKYVNLTNISGNTYKMTEKPDVVTVFDMVNKRNEYVDNVKEIKDYLDAFDVTVQS